MTKLAKIWDMWSQVSADPDTLEYVYASGETPMEGDLIIHGKTGRRARVNNVDLISRLSGGYARTLRIYYARPECTIEANPVLRPMQYHLFLPAKFVRAGNFRLLSRVDRGGEQPTWPDQ